mmetsp:Transcript_8106/g.19280  ORF Transcript_8106/g.19280 Transcript_8106/m.19280 type:complete len:313 (-) Transcript_8106:79-1017(-)
MPMNPVQLREHLHFLLRKGADPNLFSGPEKEGKRRTLLILAIDELSETDEKEAVVCVDMLLRAGADPNLRSEAGTLPLVAGIRSGKTAVVSTMIDLKVSPDGLDNTETQRSALHVAALLGDGAMCKLLVEKNGNVNASDTAGRSPLFMATSKDAVKQLLSVKADLLHLDVHRWTALHSLALHDEPKLLQACSSHPAFYDVLALENGGGCTVVDIAAALGLRRSAWAAYQLGAAGGDGGHRVPWLTALQAGHYQVSWDLFQLGLKYQLSTNQGRWELFVWNLVVIGAVASVVWTWSWLRRGLTHDTDWDVEEF